MTDYRALAARLLGHGPAMREAAAALTEAAADIERVSSLRLEQRVAELEKDAARWRWLCDVAPASVRQRLAANYDKQFQASVDAAIDKSMKGQP